VFTLNSKSVEVMGGTRKMRSDRRRSSISTESSVRAGQW